MELKSFKPQLEAMKKKANKQNTNAVAEKMIMFDKLPDKCSACDKPYDKKDKQMAMTWSVVVKENPSVVRLYCPDCWKMANDAIETLREEIENGRQ